MSQVYNLPPFEDAKKRISESSHKLYQYIIWSVIIAVILVVGLAITLIVVLGLGIEDLDISNYYDFGEQLIANGLFTTGLIAAIFLIIALIALIVILIMSYIQYYRLGSSFSKLHDAERTLETTKYISYGFYGYIIAIIAGIFVPGVGGTVVSILGNASLAVAAYLIYKLFVEYKRLGRFSGKTSMLLFIGLAVNVAAEIAATFTTYGPFGSLIGFVLILIGFRDLSRDIKLVVAPGGQQMKTEAPPADGYRPAQPATATVQPVKDQIRFCSSCGAKITAVGKFCQNCGANF